MDESRPRHDRIDLSVEVETTVADAWQLVGEPGWFINEGELTEHEVAWESDTRCRVVDPEHGPFVFEFTAHDAPRYSAAHGVDAAGEGDARLVELWVDDADAGRVRIRVVESGFASMEVPVAEQIAQYEQNVRTWRAQLELARQALETG